MEIVVLGCGTSTGVPIVGCSCDVCTSDDPRDKRSRSSIWVKLDSGNSILIDTSPDLRSQALAAGITDIDAVFYTHVHADHTHGIDEIRVFNYLKQAPVDVYGAREHIEHIRNQFRYIFEKSVQRGGGKPKVIMHEIELNRSFELFGARITPIELLHGKLLCVGWRIENFAYLTDINSIPETAYNQLLGLDVLIIDALRAEPHPTHFSIDEAVSEAKRIGAKRSYLTHMGHDVSYAETLKKVDGAIEPAYDLLRLFV